MEDDAIEEPLRLPPSPPLATTWCRLRLRALVGVSSVAGWYTAREAS